MKKDKAITFHNALQNPGLKVKFLSATNYVSVLSIKRPLTTYMNEMSENEKDLFAAYNVPLTLTIDDLEEKKKSDASFKEKLDLLYSKEFEPKETNFIPIDEFKKFVDDVSLGVSEVLAEFLLKE